MVERKMVLSDAEFTELVRRMCEMLDGLSVAQIEHVLRTIGRVVAMTTPVNAKSDAFLVQFAEEARAFHHRAN